MVHTYLVLDTSDQRGACALASVDGAIVGMSTWSSTDGHAERILVHLKDLLARQGVGVAQMSGVIVNIGPGSFTGVRAAVATAKALSMAPGLPVVAIDALAALAMTDTSTRTRVALLDAHRGDVFIAIHTGHGEVLLPPSLVAIAALAPYLDTHPNAPIVASPGVAALIARDVQSPRDDDRLATLARLGAARFARNAVDDAAVLEPLYVRPPDLSRPKAR